MDAMDAIHSRLQSTHPGRLESDAIVRPWFSQSGALEYFLEHCREVKARNILHGVGRPLMCHQTALEASVMFPKSRPWFGFRLTQTETGWLWWCHSWLVLPTGSILDPGPAHEGTRYFGLRWSAEWHQRLPRLNWWT